MTSRYRIYAAVALAGVVALGGGFRLLGRSEAASTPVPAIKPLHPVAKKPAAKVQPSAVRKQRRQPRAANGIPAAISAAFARHRVVVIALVTPRASVDELAYEEAKAGARAARAGFVRVSVARNDEVQALSTLLNSSTAADDRLLDAPAVLVFRRPHDLFVRFNGFVDTDTIAQAATNAVSN